ncbi:MAG: hypothetical protein K6T66_14230 [Peptococcaceae bacterium]|nr:hypothetical protein [Peptococcaceae bacterium]
MKKYLEKEFALLEELKIKYPEYSEKFRSIFESECLPVPMTFPLFYCTEHVLTAEVVMNLSSVAIEYFIKRYFEVVQNLINSINPKLLKKFFIKNLNYEHWEKLANQEPFFEWLVSEGLACFNRVRRLINVTTIDDLAALVRQLEYLMAFLSNIEDPQEILGYLYDLPQWLEDDLKEKDLLITERHILHDWHKYLSYHIKKQAVETYYYSDIQMGKVSEVKIKLINYIVDQSLILKWPDLQNATRKLFTGGKLYEFPAPNRTSDPAA